MCLLFLHESTDLLISGSWCIGAVGLPTIDVTISLFCRFSLFSLAPFYTNKVSGDATYLSSLLVVVPVNGFVHVVVLDDSIERCFSLAARLDVVLVRRRRRRDLFDVVVSL